MDMDDWGWSIDSNDSSASMHNRPLKVQTRSSSPHCPPWPLWTILSPGQGTHSVHPYITWRKRGLARTELAELPEWHDMACTVKRGRYRTCMYRPDSVHSLHPEYGPRWVFGTQRRLAEMDRGDMGVGQWSVNGQSLSMPNTRVSGIPLVSFTCIGALLEKPLMPKVSSAVI